MTRPANLSPYYGAALSGPTGVAIAAIMAAGAWKHPVRVATTAAGTLASSFENGDTIDGVVLATGDRLLIKDQAAGAENGIYVVNASGTPTRATDFDSEADILESVVVVTSGTTNVDTVWLCTTNAPITVGTTALTFASFAAPIGADYLVGTTQSALSAEIVVGTTPGGELGGTWASPTVDATHSGTPHHAQDHAARHAAAGADAVKLDDLAAPDDNTDLNATTGAHGLLPKLAGGTTQFLRADGTWVAAGGSGTGGLLASITAASAAIANTETVVVSASLAANSMVAGMSFRIRAAGVGTTGLTPGVDTFRIRIGTTTLTGNIPCSVAPPNNISVTAQPFSFEALVTVRTAGAGGTIIGECLAVGDDAATGLFTLLVDLSAVTATVAVDTTVANLLELTFQSGAASSSGTFHVATIEGLGTPGTFLTDPMTTRGDTIYRDSANATNRLAVGATGTFVGSDGTDKANRYPPGYQLDYTENTGGTTITATTEAGATTYITGASVAYDGATAVIIEVFIEYAAIVTSGATGRVILFQDGSSIGEMAIFSSVSATTQYFTVFARRKLTPTNASHTYSIRGYKTAGTVSFNGGAGGSGASMPSYLRITKA